MGIVAEKRHLPGSMMEYYYATKPVTLNPGNMNKPDEYDITRGSMS